MDLQRYAVPTEKLRWQCDCSAFPFQTTADIPPLKGLVEQDRPVRAIRFGLGIRSPGYNIYVSGLTGTGKTTVIKQFLDDIATTLPTPDDWCFLHNFRNPEVPIAVNLPAGMAKTLRDEMDELVNHLKSEIPKSFDSKEYEQSVHVLLRENQEEQQAQFNQLSEKARKEGFSLNISKLGVSLIPLIDNKPATQEQYDALEDETKNSLETRRQALQQDINAFLRQVRDINKRSRDQVNELNRQIGNYVVGGRLEGIKEQFSTSPGVNSYLEDVRDHILSHLDDFTDDGQKQEGQAPAGAARPAPEPSSDPFLKYKVNIIVDNTSVKGAPVVIETNPTYYNMFGRIDRVAYLGALQTDFTMIAAGSYMKANGGFLVVNAHDVLLNFGVWESLKRAVKNKEIRIEDLSVQYGLVPVAGMRPSPIPTNVKVIMIGNQWIYHLLYGMDEDFRKIFKVKADFDSRMDRDARSLQSYASFISNRCHHENLLHFDASGVAEVIEYGARLVDEQEKLSSRFSDIADIVREASYWAAQDGKEIVAAEYVTRAIEEKLYRSNLVEFRLREFITEGTLLVDVTGDAVGQVNGLAVIDMGDIRFGKPSRITAKTFMGKSGVVDIERESKMSGRIYEKGVLILGGFLGARYAQERPLSLSASICFEQSYEGVDGDSASSTELYALLSSLADLPIRQGIAVTGSVNQHGEIQPIGGVNQKIEGFYDVCKAKGLTGDQGVMIPVQNVKNLMLRPDVVDAVTQGRFRIYAVASIDEGIEILMDRPAGVRTNGSYPEGTVNHLVEKRLKEFVEGLKQYGEAAGEKEKSKGGCEKC
jgi:lon-related putative ATP-dependent protease